VPGEKQAKSRVTIRFSLLVCASLLVALLHFSGCATDKGPKKTPQDTPSVTSIHSAAATGDVALVGSLLERNPALVEQPDGRGRTPLHAAAAAGQKAVVDLLLAKGASVDAKDKENPAKTLNDRMVRSITLITAAGELRGEQEMAVHVWGRETPLFCAARNGHSDVAELLISKGAGVNTKDAWGRTPLHHAAGAGATEVVRLLLSEGANVNGKDGIDETPLYVAAIGGHVDTARLLLSSGANADAHGDTSGTPLHMAAWAGHSDLARLLLSEGARVNAKNGCDDTPLHLAARTGQTEVAQLLLSAGASVNAKNGYDQTPLDVAAQDSQAKIARLLVARGANPNARNGAGDTPLHTAARQAGLPPDLGELLERRPLTDAQAAALEVYEVLRAAGANAKAKNRIGDTPSEMAPRFEIEYGLSRPVHRRPASGR